MCAASFEDAKQAGDAAIRREAFVEAEPRMDPQHPLSFDMCSPGRSELKLVIFCSKPEVAAQPGRSKEQCYTEALKFRSEATALCNRALARALPVLENYVFRAFQAGSTACLVFQSRVK